MTIVSNDGQVINMNSVTSIGFNTTDGHYVVDDDGQKHGISRKVYFQALAWSSEDQATALADELFSSVDYDQTVEAASVYGQQ